VSNKPSKLGFILEQDDPQSRLFRLNHYADQVTDMHAALQAARRCTSPLLINELEEQSFEMMLAALNERQIAYRKSRPAR